MQIKISETNPGFAAINTKSVEKILRKKRLVGLVTGRYEEYRDLEKSQINNPYDIVLTEGKFKSLRAEIVSNKYGVVWRYKESIWNGIINSNPNKFIEKMCMLADYFKNNPAKAEHWASIQRTEDSTGNIVRLWKHL